MARPRRWVPSEVVNGYIEIKISSWKCFNDFVCQVLQNHNSYIFRGQRRSDWPLEPTLERAMRQYNLYDEDERNNLRQYHLENFIYATRGRRGGNPPELKTENDWWALGQHNGLLTPLLDWSTSPYVAAFFAFSEIGEVQTDYRAIYALHVDSVRNISEEIKKAQEDSGKPQMVEIIKPISDENPRLVNQGGLFTRSPDGIDLETWVDHYFEDEMSYILIKILIPNRDRENCLITLNRMNINHLTLFPDLYGASHYCNLDLTIPTY